MYYSKKTREGVAQLICAEWERRAQKDNVLLFTWVDRTNPLVANQWVTYEETD